MKAHSASDKPVKSVKFGLSSIGTRLFLAVMAAATVGLGGLGTLFYRELKSVRLLQLTAETDVKVRELDAELRSSESFLKSLVAATAFLQESGVRSPKAYEQLVLSFLPARPNLITGFGVMQLPQGLVDRQWFGPYVEESQPNRGRKVAGDAKFSLVDLWQADQYPELQYYTEAVRADHFFWSEPYLNEVYPIPLMTFAGPIRDRRGNMIAIMNGDINIKDLSQTKPLSSDSTYYALVTQTGTLLSYSPEPIKASKLENIASIPALKSTWQEIQHELDQGKFQGYLESNSTKSYWVYQKVPSSQWVMLQAVPYAAVVKPALSGAILATFVAGIILAVVVSLFVRFLNQRLQPILEVCDATLVQEENLIQSKDEISRLSDAFFCMMERQNALLQQLQEANIGLVQSNRLKDNFLANMSHELRTPLNAILGLTEGLQEEVFGQINPQQQEILRTIEGSGAHLLILISDILDLAKIESGQIELNCIPTAIEPLCQSSLGFIKQQALKKHIQLQVQLSADLPNLVIDELRIRQVLINLLSNAIKFTPEGGKVTLEVTVETLTHLHQKKARFVRFTVVDTGIGIAAKHHSKLFSPFIQIDGGLNRNYEGTGLGLALVKQIVELHGGKVEMTSEVGVGSCFWVDLPCPDLPVEGILPLSKPGSGTTNLSSDEFLGKSERELTGVAVKAASSRPLTHLEDSVPLIMLVEDDEANIQTISSYLNAKGYRLVVARHGQEAINLVRLQQPDLILMDIQMPGMNGLQTIQQIRCKLFFKDVPIIALTALAMTGDRERCLDAGANEYLTKPVKLKQLTTIIQQVLADNQA